jgi:16S rRNA (cytidine1402-2'-O)-methyltransferase
MLADAAEVFGARQGAVARELTKLFETVKRGTLSELAKLYAEMDTPKGEIVVLIGPPLDDAPSVDTQDLDNLLRKHLAHLSVKDATAVVVADTGLPKRQVYARAVALARGDGE